MNSKKVFVVYRKELLEVLRDKRTLFTTLLLPILLYPLLIVGFNQIMSRQTDVLEKQGATIAIKDSVNSEVSDEIIRGFNELENYTILPYTETVDTLYSMKDIQAIVTIRDSISTSDLKLYQVYIQYDAANEKGQMVYGKLRDSLVKSEKKILSDHLELSGMNPEMLSMLSVRQRDTSTSQRKMGRVLGMFLPYILIIMLLTGASVVAADLVAGEKERKTLETLLVSGIGRKEIVIGKYLTIITLGMLNLIINLFSISFSLKFMLSQQGIGMDGVTMPIKAIAILLAAMLPLATLFSAILLSISTFSRNMKEARTYEQPLMMVSMMMAMISFIPAIELNNLLALIPIINIALLFKAVMVNEYAVSHLLITIGSTVLLDIVAIWATIKLFSSENILFRSDDDSGSLKGLKKNKASFFNPYNGIVWFSLGLIALYYLGTYLQMKDLAKGLIYTQLLIILFPVSLALKLLKQNANQVLRFKAPRIKEVVLIPFMAIPAAIIVAIISQVINMIYPFPEHYLEQLSKLFKMDMPLWKSFLIIAILPGICEEVLFRGLMPRFFEKYGMKVNIIITAVLFAVFHLDPFRFIPVLLLGFLLGYQTLRSGSIVNSMLSHTINNGLALFITAFATQPWINMLISDGDNLHFWLAAPAMVVLLISIYLFHKVTGEEKCAE